MENPFEGLTYKKREKKLLPPGKYEAELTNIRRVNVKDKKTGEEKPKIVFSFSIPKHDTEVAQFVYPSLKPGARMHQFVTMISGGTIPAADWDSFETLWPHVRLLVGCSYDLMLVVNGEWNNITAAIPHQLPSPTKPVAAGGAEPLFTDDEIPF